MNKTLKAVLITVNAIMLILAVYWYYESSEIEPLIVFLGQTASILILIFEKKLSKNLVSKVSDSKVRIKTSKDDDSHIEVKNIKKKSDVKIERK
ncbi:hypothetical protein [Psychroserpens sp.]|uniref:hypothetical protein n=1 Tax=Psychroserpens sp. TaxID=2020870 RepID=UPI001B097FDB|nr:hypothetical protein [Psychroserpens sp.]MBO6607408.1 hypothetical protein [Psychroserpens sp.]MBO6654514.1 hypothetical protein [Psychroserpens sp.]MBO6681137.1 hypothetical protein [Psychroserpens sp.]MBO6749906.1 hypothetical protein [Psychroserpens sp.]MBO6916106.1 hypothetical protein [Psychroserpens sp.]